jgi:TolB protein
VYFEEDVLMKQIIYALVILALSLFLSCRDDVPTNGGEPPCLDCPFNFRLTDFEPAWSPDGKTIAYVHGDTVNGQTGLWLIDTSGANKRLLYASIGAYSPTWSPNGQWIAFSDNAQIFKMKINGDSLQQLTNEGRNFSPSWSPDGRWITYDVSLPVTSAGIWIMRNDGSQGRRIFGGAYPTWNPDSKSILAVIGTSATSIWTRFLIYYLDSSHPNDTLPATTGNNNSYPRYSPDGKLIAYTSDPYGGKSQIWVINSDGTKPRQLTTMQGYSCDWAPAGNWIVYTNSDTVSGKLWLIRSDGSENHSLSF